SHFRYFFPVLMTLLFQLSYTLYLYIRKLREAHQTWVAGACFVVAVGCLVRPVVPLEQYAVLSRVKPYTEFAIESGTRFLAGDYWEVWPSVFELLNVRGYGFGLAYRAVGNRRNALDGLISELGDRGELRMLCLSGSGTACSDELEGFTQRKWRVIEEKQQDKC